MLFTRGSGRERRDASREVTDENGFRALLRTASSAFVSVGCHYRGTCNKDAFNGPKRMATAQVACSRTPVVLTTSRAVLHIFKTLKFLFLLFFNTFFLELRQ